VPSGVGTQCKYIFEGLLKTGRYSIRSLGGAMKHQDYRIVKTKEFEDDWLIIPTDRLWQRTNNKTNNGS